ncbi:MAG: hypothetical protein LBI90_03595 [Treponema sp.]|nr:hypothetical protein [Treponema sp.]
MLFNACAGITHPKIEYFFYPLVEKPPFRAEERLAAGAAYPQVFTIFMPGVANSFKQEFLTSLFVNKPYTKLYIYKMTGEWDTGSFIFLADKSYSLAPENYETGNGWYWRGNSKKIRLCEANLEKIFKKKLGDTFYFRLIIEYSFDGEPVSVQIIEYEAVAKKGIFIAPDRYF